MLNILNLNPALEDLENGVVATEKEYVWYGRLVDTSILQKATTSEQQSQATIKQPDGTIRVRRVMSNGSVRYVLTAKAWKGRGECAEVSQGATEDMYEVFCGIAKQTMDKIRYSFPGPNGTVFELDVFTRPDGSLKEWCKIDWEVPQNVTEFPPLPIPLEDVIFGGNEEYTPEQRKAVDQLLNKEFVNPCAYKA